jgi:hypothetical protein
MLQRHLGWSGRCCIVPMQRHGKLISCAVLGGMCAAAAIHLVSAGHGLSLLLAAGWRAAALALLAANGGISRMKACQGGLYLATSVKGSTLGGALASMLAP